jgi:hypothetical protein
LFAGQAIANMAMMLQKRKYLFMSVPPLVGINPSVLSSLEIQAHALSEKIIFYAQTASVKPKGTFIFNG